jgi:hypothetical protein
MAKINKHTLAPAVVVLVAILFLALSCSVAFGNINLEWRPTEQTVSVGETVNIGLYAVSDDETDQLFLAIDLGFAWDPLEMQLLGLDDTGALELDCSAFLVHVLNEETPPQDGDGYYAAWAPLFGPTPAATPEGALVTTFQFEALSQTPGTLLEMLEEYTIVFDGTIPGLDVTGTLGSAVVTIVWMFGDFDYDGDVDLSDFTVFADCMAGPATTPTPTPPVTAADCLDAFDFDADADVDIGDFAELLVVFTGD